MNKFKNRLTFLPLFTLSFCLGIFLIKFIDIPFFNLYFLCGIFIFLSFFFIRKEYSVFFLLFVGLLLGSLSLKNFYFLSPSDITKFSIPKSERLILKGVVDDFPLCKTNHTTFILELEEIVFRDKVYKSTGKILVRDFSKREVSYGDFLLLRGRLFRPHKRIKGFSYRDYLKQKGIYRIFNVGRNDFIKKLAEKPNLLKKFAYQIRTKSLDILFKYLPFTQAAIFSAMLLGERSYIQPYFNRLFIQTGTMHILAISGLHVGIFAFILNILLKALGLKKRLRYLLIILFLIFYCLLTGSRPPVVRATIMAIVLLIGFFLKRAILISHSLSIACLLILIPNPSEIFDIGFQLSFLSVIFIIYLSPKMKTVLFKDRFQDIKILRFLINAISLSLACWLGLLPFILYYFKIISPITVIANMLIVPYLGIVISLGICFLSFSFISSLIAPIFAQPANLSIVILIKIVEFFNRIPFAYFYLK